MRLLGLQNLYPPVAGGGYGEICADVMEGLAARGHDVTVLTAAGSAAADEKRKGVTVRRELDYVLAPWRRPIHGMRAVRHDRRILEQELSAGVDAALVWHMRGLVKPSLTLLHRAGVPVLYFLHDRWALYERAGSLFVPWARLDRLGTRRLRARLLRAPPIAEDGLVCFVSRWLENEHLRRGWKPQRSAVVPCGVAVDRFARERSAPPASPPRRLLFAGRIHPEKGLDIALRALAGAPGAARLTVVGPVDQPRYLSATKALADELGVAARVDWAGEVGRAEVAQMLGSHDVLLYPSVAVEAYSLGLLEGLAAGIAIVTSAVGGPQEYLRGGENALVFDPGDVDALSEHLRRLAHEPELVARLARGARETAERMSLDRVVDQVESLLAASVSARAAAVPSA